MKRIDQVDRLVADKGPQLQLLHLEHVDELDMAALQLVASSCPSLQKLVFINCDFVENFVSENLASTTFQSLTSLVCVSECAPNVIEFLLVHAKSLQNVQFGLTAWFNDQIVSSVLARYFRS